MSDFAKMGILTAGKVHFTRFNLGDPSDIVCQLYFGVKPK